MADLDVGVHSGYCVWNRKWPFFCGICLRFSYWIRFVLFMFFLLFGCCFLNYWSDSFFYPHALCSHNCRNWGHRNTCVNGHLWSYTIFLGCTIVTSGTTQTLQHVDPIDYFIIMDLTTYQVGNNPLIGQFVPFALGWGDIMSNSLNVQLCLCNRYSRTSASAGK